MVYILLLALVACDQRSFVKIPAAGDTEITDDTPDEPTSDVDLDMTAKLSNVAVIRSVPWPGGGRELTVRVVDDDGLPVMDPELEIITEPEVDLEMAIAPVSLAPGYLGLVMLPGASQAEIDAAVELIWLRPEQEEIAIYLASEPGIQIAGFTKNRARLEGILNQVPSVDLPPAIDIDLALTGAAELISDVAGSAPRSMRSAVVFTEETELDPSSDIPFLRIGTGVDVKDVSDWIDDTATSGHWTVSVCGPPEELAATMDWEDGNDGFSLDATLPEELNLSCDPADIGPDKRDFTDTIGMVFTAEQRNVYQQRINQGSSSDFALSVDFGGGRELITATAHLRGNGSFWCDRKNYVLQLDDSENRTLFEGSFADEFILLSMCLDQAYVEQHVANQLMTESGAWQLKNRYIELSLDGQTSGVYMILEKTREELVRDQTQVRSVLRRGYWEFVAKWSYDGNLNRAEAAGEAIWDGLGGLSGLALQEEVDSRLDLEAYIRWLALNSAIQNGDYVDEAWFVSAQALMADGSIGEYFETMAWDADDLLVGCHDNGNNAYPDPWGLAYCAEDDLDFTLLRDPETYERFVDTLEDVLLNEIPPIRFDSAATLTQQAILPFFDRPGVPQAMEELGEDTPIGAKSAVVDHLQDMKDEYATRHALLLTRIATYRAAN